MAWESTKVHEAKRMWEGGPLRQFALVRGSANWTQYDGGGYAGLYVCDQCQKPTSGGVYRTAAGVWKCAGCKE